MFCVLKVQKRRNTLFEKVFGSFIKDEYDVQTIPVFKGAPFYLMNITLGKRGMCWEDVITAVGKCSSRLVTNCEIALPQNVNVGLFKSEVLYDKMMKNTFIQILENNDTKNHPVSVSISDEKAEYTEFTKRLSLYASTLTIATQNKEKYFSVCEEITENIGLCPVLKTDFDNAKVKINTCKNIMTIDYDGQFLNIDNGENFTVPQIYENLLPDGVNKYDFYSALYELCGVFSLGNCIFENIYVNNEKKPVADVHFA